MPEREGGRGRDSDFGHREQDTGREPWEERGREGYKGKKSTQRERGGDLIGEEKHAGGLGPG